MTPPTAHNKDDDIDRQEGKVATLLDTYGFIAPTAGGTEVFFHNTALKGVRFEDLSTGDRVTYATVETSKGLRAVAVKRK